MMVFRCDCCQLEVEVSSEQEIPVQLRASDEQLCQACLTLVSETQRARLAVRPSWVLSLLASDVVVLPSV